MKFSNNSSPCPDGIPYGAWRRLGDLAMDIIFDAFETLTSNGGEEDMVRNYPSFNESLLFILPPKKGLPERGW